jgi:hypothetical protein
MMAESDEHYFVVYFTLPYNRAQCTADYIFFVTLKFNVISLMLHYTTVGTFDIHVSGHTTKRQTTRENCRLIRSQFVCVCVCVM